MRKVRLIVAVWAAKLAIVALRLLKRNATQLPGRIALPVCPSLIADIAKPAQIIAVTGTNGKTTTSNLMAQALVGEGHAVLNNSFGSNTAAGVASTLIAGVDWLGRSKYPVAVFEVDERSALLILPGLHPQLLICTNLTRDSIERNAHPEFIAWLLSRAISDDTTLVLNADDLISARLGKPAAKRVLFGIDALPGDGTTPSGAAIDLSACPQCGATLAWNYWRYNHIGHAHCDACGFESPTASYRVKSVDFDAATVTIDAAGHQITAHLLNDNIVNVYNQVAVTAALDTLGVPLPHIVTAFDHLAPPSSRYIISKVGQVTLVRHLAKGAVGVSCSRAFQYVTSMPGNKAIVLNIDDAHDVREDCQNNCWVFDTDYEYFANPSVKQIVIGGVRRYDHELRLQLAGVDPAIIDTTPVERDTADLVRLDGIDRVINIHSLYNTSTTGVPVGERLAQRLMARKTGGQS